eukprot:scaffold124227_cov30-Phaeocystis_antarctica.AAC.2
MPCSILKRGPLPVFGWSYVWVQRLSQGRYRERDRILLSLPRTSAARKRTSDSSVTYHYRSGARKCTASQWSASPTPPQPAGATWAAA